ncbi:MAG: 4-hydroxy-3-methylbut-2-enyl diphosphate reductase, partial [Deltaproteobacteria bacterium]|nr:4-hydroxy-3-methylbut-2-enyl diphosphate reductase [Deltaproteobacteria bacterium]
SNSNRLREVASDRGLPAYLIDHADEVDPAWLEGVERVGVTAGASAPEYFVEELISWLQENGASSVREMEGEDEMVHFQMPKLS